MGPWVKQYCHPGNREQRTGRALNTVTGTLGLRHPEDTSFKLQLLHLGTDTSNCSEGLSCAFVVDILMSLDGGISHAVGGRRTKCGAMT